jgi:hypothetical protein
MAHRLRAPVRSRYIRAGVCLGVVLLFGFAIAVAWLIWAMLFREELLVVVNVGVYPTSVPGVSRVVLAVGRDIGQPTRTNPKYEKY